MIIVAKTRNTRTLHTTLLCSTCGQTSAIGFSFVYALLLLHCLCSACIYKLCFHPKYRLLRVWLSLKHPFLHRQHPCFLCFLLSLKPLKPSQVQASIMKPPISMLRNHKFWMALGSFKFGLPTCQFRCAFSSVASLLVSLLASFKRLTTWKRSEAAKVRIPIRLDWNVPF